MVVVLSIFLVLAIMAVIVLYKTMVYIILNNTALTEQYIDLKQWYNDNIEKEFPCTIAWTFNNDWEFEGSIYDFSLYDDYNIIGLTECYKDKHITKSEYFIDNNTPSVFFIPNQKVVLLKDGNYEWDLRQYL